MLRATAMVLCSAAVSDVHVFQVDTRNPQDQTAATAVLGLSVTWNQKVVAQRKHWRYSFVNASRLCPAVKKEATCDVGGGISPVWMKVMGMVHVADYSDPSVVNVFLDSDAVLGSDAQVGEMKRDIYFAREVNGWWTAQCTLANYSACINTGVVVFRSTAPTRGLLRRWWARRFETPVLTPYERFRRGQGTYRTSTQWCWEQDHISEMLSGGGDALVGYMTDHNGVIEDAPITHITHFHQGHKLRRMTHYTGNATGGGLPPLAPLNVIRL